MWRRMPSAVLSSRSANPGFTCSSPSTCLAHAPPPSQLCRRLPVRAPHTARCWRRAAACRCACARFPSWLLLPCCGAVMQLACTEGTHCSANGATPTTLPARPCVHAQHIPRGTRAAVVASTKRRGRQPILLCQQLRHRPPGSDVMRVDSDARRISGASRCPAERKRMDVRCWRWDALQRDGRGRGRDVVRVRNYFIFACGGERV